MRTLFLLFIIFMTSCETNRIIYYRSGKTEITRFDSGRVTGFYLGRYSVDNLPTKPCVKAEYYGLNNGLDLIIVFKSNSNLEFISMGGGRLTNVNCENAVIPIYRNDFLQGILDNYKDYGFSMIRISDALDLEKAFPENQNSKVIAEY